tara:strand:+ start:3934 stop:4392 length:459 start_codon:yes stop_codon:yes gene_type:complete
MADDPFKNYGLLQRIKDHNLMTVLANPVDAMEHITFPEAIAQRIRRENPQLGERIDRGLLDIAVNFAGGYDWAAREGISPKVAKEMARAYQFKDYADRPNDSIQDFYENVAGIDAFTGQRVPSSQLIDMALEYARQKTQKMADSREQGIIGE